MHTAMGAPSVGASEAPRDSRRAGDLAEQGGHPCVCVWVDPNYMGFPCCYRGGLRRFPFASSCRLLNTVITDAVDTMRPVSL